MTVEERYERLHTLLVQRATEGCSDEEHREIDTLLREFPDVREDDWDLVATRTELELLDLVSEESLDTLETPPTSVREALAREASSRRPAKAPTSRRAVLPWLAAAAAVVVALYGVTLLPGRALDPAAARAALLERHPDAITLAWTPTEDPAATAGLSGDLVWSGGAQRGFMRFIGLAPNDPSLEQYQLWIFDQTRPEATPVDGGVFDIPVGAEEVVIPIDAKLSVGTPHLFAVTVERPGGVVVSDRSRIAALASVPE